MLKKGRGMVTKGSTLVKQMKSEIRLETLSMTNYFQFGHDKKGNTWSGLISRILSRSPKDHGDDHVSETHVTVSF